MQASRISVRAVRLHSLVCFEQGGLRLRLGFFGLDAGCPPISLHPFLFVCGTCIARGLLGLLTKKVEVMGNELTFNEKHLMLKALEFYLARQDRRSLDLVFQGRVDTIALIEKVREWE